jgi:beta-lactamase regulating signal transducer with metallopeptidase domain
MAEFAHSAAAAMLNSLLPGLLLLMLAWLLARFLGRNSSAALRFSVWLVALAAIAILPWVGSNGAPSYPMGPAHSTVSLTLPARLAAYVFVIWILGALFGIARLALGLYRLMKLRATCRPVELDTLDPLLCSTLAEVQPQRRVTLCVSDTVRVPAALGYFRPIVVFPRWAFAEIPAPELNAILLHELAHLRRYDDWTNLAQKFVKAVLFFHPAVWLIEPRLTLEREMACDEAVLAANFSPRDYAESLVNLAEKSFLRRGIQLAQAAVGHVRQLKQRLAEILRQDKDKDKQGSARPGKPALAALSVAALISSFAISHSRQLVTFSTTSSTTVAVNASSQKAPSELHLQPVNLRYSEPLQSNSMLSAHATASGRRVHATRVKPRTVFLQRAGTSPFAAEMPLSPALLLANFPINLAPSAGPVLLVFQGGELGPNGPVLWRVTVFRLSPAQQRIVTGTVPKQI